MSDRNEEIIERYREGASANDLGRMFCLSEARVRQIVGGVKKEKKQIEKVPISRAHKRLGYLICDYRFDHKIDRKIMAQKLGWSIGKLINIDQGLRDPSLLDLLDLSTYMKLDFGDLINNAFNRH